MPNVEQINHDLGAVDELLHHPREPYYETWEALSDIKRHLQHELDENGPYVLLPAREARITQTIMEQVVAGTDVSSYAEEAQVVLDEIRNAITGGEA